MMAQNEFAPVTPGEMLKEEFLAEYGLSQNQLAKSIGISPNRIAEIVNNRRRITADTALRLGKVFGTTPLGLNMMTSRCLRRSWLAKPMLSTVGLAAISCAVCVALGLFMIEISFLTASTL